MEVTVAELVLDVTAVTVALAAEPEAPYPEGYRDWHHVKSMVIEEGYPLYDAFGVIHRPCANDKALEGYQSDTFPDGAVGEWRRPWRILLQAFIGEALTQQLLASVATTDSR